MTITEPAPELVPAELSITQLVRNPNNREPVVDDLFVESIRTVGVLQPIRVRRTVADDTFEIEDGERRWVGAGFAGRTTVPCLIVQDMDRDAVIARLVGNLHRKDFEPLELAGVFAELREFGMTQTEIAAVAGCEQPWVSRVLALLKTSSETQEQLRAGQITMKEALATLRPARAPETEGGSPDREAGGDDGAATPRPPDDDSAPPSEDVGGEEGQAASAGAAPAGEAEVADEATTSGEPDSTPDQDPASGTAVAPGDVQEEGVAASGDGAGGDSGLVRSAPSPDVEFEKPALAKDVVIDWTVPEVRIDGTPFPWYLTPEGPTVTYPEHEILQEGGQPQVVELGAVHLSVLVDPDGSITEIGEPGVHEREPEAAKAEPAALSNEDLASLAQVEPWPGYDEQTVDDVVSELDMPGTDDALTRHVRAYEREHGGRPAVLARCDYHLGDA